MNSSFPQGVFFFRFDHTQLPKTVEILKIAKLMSCMNFQLSFRS